MENTVESRVEKTGPRLRETGRQAAGQAPRREAPPEGGRPQGAALWLFPLAALGAALGVGACCAFPLLLFLAGVSGVWISHLTALEPYRPLFLAAALAAIGGGLLRLRQAERAACAGAACPPPASRRLMRAVLWFALVLAGIGFALPYLARFFLV